MDQQTSPPPGARQMQALIAAHDWSASPIGPLAGWPSSLRTLVAVMLDARQPMHVAWGAARTLIYNDAYAQILGRKHPSALGRPWMDVWPEVASVMAPLFDRVFAGHPIQMDDIKLMVERHGRLEEAHFAFSYTPVRDDRGGVAGLFCSCTDTTAQVLAEQRRAADLERQRRLFASAPGFIGILHGPSMIFEFVNAAFVTLFGGRDFVGKTLREAFPDIEGQGFHEVFDQVYATGRRVVARQTRIRLRQSPDMDPQDRYLDFIYEPMRDDRGEVTGIFIEGYDVTEAHQAVEALRNSDAQLRSLNADLERQVVERARERGRTWQVSPDLLSVMNRAGIFEMTNPAWEAVLGWTAAELSRMPWQDLVHPDDLTRSLAGFGELLRGQPVLRFENRYRSKAGHYRWLSWVAVPEDGRFYCSARDVTLEKNQAAKLAARTMERDRLWRNSQDLLVVIDTQGVFKAVSPAATKILGWAAEEMVGRSVFDFILPEDHASTGGALAHATRSELPIYVNRYRHKDGGFRWLSWVAAPEGDLIYATARHITAEKEQAEALARTEEALRQSQKMEAVGQLTGGLAHDFNNLLTGITGSLELLEARLAQGRTGDLGRYITAALGASRRAAALTHRLLAFSRRQTLDPRPTDVNRLVSGMEDLVRRTVGPSIAIEVVGAAGLWPTLVDPNQLENALLNLCINARDAMPDGGRLTIETSNKWLDERSAKERELLSGQYISLCVSDTGLGMTAEVIRRAFDPFFTTKPIGQGTGLGLSMIYGFVRQSGGQVRIYSEPGQGAMVCLYLPRHLGVDDSAETAPDPVAAPRSEQGETVLVVDDEPTVRMLVADVLQELGYGAIEAGDGPAGLVVLQSARRIDLLVTDVGLPGGMNGRQVADAGRALRPGLKVLFITGYAENAVIGNGHLDHGMHVLTKPFAVQTLASRIRDIMTGRPP